jgi:hypothetical protein
LIYRKDVRNMTDQKNNPGTAANGNEIIRKQIELLEQVNQKLVDGLNSHPVSLTAYSDIRYNSLAIMTLVKSIGGQSVTLNHDIAVECEKKIDDVFQSFLNPNKKPVTPCTIKLYSKESALAESQDRIGSIIAKQGTTITEDSDEAILKPFLIDGGRFIVEADVTNLESVMFSIRGEIDSKSITNMFRTSEMFLKKIINDNGRSGKC